MCLIGPSKVSISRTIAVKSQKETVLKKIGDFRCFHDEWSPWTRIEPEMEVDYKGTPGEMGHYYFWKGTKDSVGTGSMEIDSVLNNGYRHALVFSSPQESKAITWFLVNEKDSLLEIEWKMEMQIPFPGRAFMLFMNMDKMIGPDFESGLNNLKTALESGNDNELYNGYKITVENWEEKTFVGIKGEMKIDSLKSFFSKNFNAIFKKLGESKLQATGAPTAIYYKWDVNNNETEAAAVMQVMKGAIIKNIDSFVTDASKVLTINYYGNYDKIGDVHIAMDEYIKHKKLTQGIVLESYISGPQTESDTSKWHTTVHYFVK